MSDFEHEIDEALLSENTLPNEKVVSWVESASEIRTLSKLYRLTRDRYYQIRPELASAITCGLIQRYLLKCIEENIVEKNEDIRDEDEILSRWEAADTLHIWFRHLLEKGEADDTLRTAAKAVTGVFLSGTEGVRDAIEMGFLEHALESEGLRPYFEHWSADPVLKDAWERALEWGKAHPNFTWEMLQRIPKA